MYQISDDETGILSVLAEESFKFITDADRRAKYRKKILSMGEIEKFILRHVDNKILWAYRDVKPFEWKEVEI